MFPAVEMNDLGRRMSDISTERRKMPYIIE